MEASIMEMLHDVHCVRLFNIFDGGDSVYLSLELCDGGDLFTRITDGQYGRHDLSVCTMLQILCGVEHLASQGIIHCDLKPENILLDSCADAFTATARICDFGAAVRCDGSGFYTGSFVGTPLYMPPEQRTGHFNTQVDVWACGCILYEMLSNSRLRDDIFEHACWNVDGDYVKFVPGSFLEAVWG